MARWLTLRMLRTNSASAYVRTKHALAYVWGKKTCARARAKSCVSVSVRADTSCVSVRTNNLRVVSQYSWNHNTYLLFAVNTHVYELADGSVLYTEHVVHPVQLIRTLVSHGVRSMLSCATITGPGSARYTQPCPVQL